MLVSTRRPRWTRPAYLFTATRCNRAIRAQYERLRAAGKSFRCAMAACARKLLTILNSMAARDEHWKP